MKRKLFLILALILSVSLLLVACGNDNAPSETVATTPSTEAPAVVADTPHWDNMAPTTRLIMATGGVTGVYYPFGGVIASVINDITNLQINAIASNASADNIRQIAAGDTHVAFAQNDVMYYAFTATSIWEDQDPVPNLATLMVLYPETVQIVVLADSGIYSVADLRGRLVSIGAVASGVEANAIQILAAYGIDRDDFTVFQLPFGESANAMRDGNLDAFFVTSGTPTTAVLELATARDLRILSLSDAAMTSLQADYPFYVRVEITNDEALGYSFITEPVQTLAVQATLATSSDLDEQVAYDIVRAIIEGQPNILTGHIRGGNISLENAVASVSVPLHPGALRFFQEAGVID